MSNFSDATQKAALDVAIRAILWNERPRPAERELLAEQLRAIKARIEMAEARKKDAAGKGAR